MFSSLHLANNTILFHFGGIIKSYALSLPLFGNPVTFSFSHTLYYNTIKFTYPFRKLHPESATLKSDFHQII